MKQKDEAYQLLEKFRTDQKYTPASYVVQKKKNKFTPLELLGCALSISMILYGGYHMLPFTQTTGVDVVEANQEQIWEVDQVKSTEQDLLLAGQELPFVNSMNSKVNWLDKASDKVSLVFKRSDAVYPTTVALVDSQNESKLTSDLSISNSKTDDDLPDFAPFQTKQQVKETSVHKEIRQENKKANTITKPKYVTFKDEPDNNINQPVAFKGKSDTTTMNKSTTSTNKSDTKINQPVALKDQSDQNQNKPLKQDQPKPKRNQTAALHKPKNPINLLLAVEEENTDRKKSKEKDGVQTVSQTTLEEDHLKSENKSTSEEESSKDDSKSSTKEDSFKSENKSTPEEESSKSENKVTPKEDSSKNENKSTPEEESSKSENKVTPKEDNSKTESKSTSKEDSGKTESKVTPKEDRPNNEIKVTPAKNSPITESKTTTKVDRVKIEPKTTEMEQPKAESNETANDEKKSEEKE